MEIILFVKNINWPIQQVSIKVIQQKERKNRRNRIHRKTIFNDQRVENPTKTKRKVFIDKQMRINDSFDEFLLELFRFREKTRRTSRTRFNRRVDSDVERDDEVVDWISTSSIHFSDWSSLIDRFQLEKRQTKSFSSFILSKCVFHHHRDLLLLLFNQSKNPFWIDEKEKIVRGEFHV